MKRKIYTFLPFASVRDFLSNSANMGFTYLTVVGLYILILVFGAEASTTTTLTVMSTTTLKQEIKFNESCKQNDGINPCITDNAVCSWEEEDIGYKCICMETAPYFYNNACIAGLDITVTGINCYISGNQALGHASNSIMIACTSPSISEDIFDVYNVRIVNSTRQWSFVRKENTNYRLDNLKSGEIYQIEIFPTKDSIPSIERKTIEGVTKINFNESCTQIDGFSPCITENAECQEDENSSYKCVCMETAPYFYNNACIAGLNITVTGINCYVIYQALGPASNSIMIACTSPSISEDIFDVYNVRIVNSSLQWNFVRKENTNYILDNLKSGEIYHIEIFPSKDSIPSIERKTIEGVTNQN
ncbi:hypothetical protein MAR_018966 [Mya arenaria]|uniref:Uncharacterized protein n=1 Tax=Mya arenaria TaxID=6604 RepID=A0ABY7EK37_MYAAR|nr:hypothetical protein MAR_018966 [Mya arenaria]